VFSREPNRAEVSLGMRLRRREVKKNKKIKNKKRQTNKQINTEESICEACLGSE
jgi:hypothetical protein